MTKKTTAKEPTKTKKEEKKVTSPTQSDIIREAIKQKKSRAKVITLLAEFAGKDEKWAGARLKVFEKAYGVISDTK